MQTRSFDTSQSETRTDPLGALRMVVIAGGVVAFVIVVAIVLLVLVFYGITRYFGETGGQVAIFLSMFVILWLLVTWVNGRVFQAGANIAKEVHGNTVQGYIAIQQSDDNSEMKKAYVQSLPRIMEVMAAGQKDIHAQANEISRHARFLMSQDGKKPTAPPPFMLPHNTGNDSDDDDDAIL